MGKLQEFSINVSNNPSLTYYPGGYVTGCVIIKLSEAKKFRGLSVCLVGEAHVKWDETRSEGTGENSSTTTETYSNHEKYIDQKVILYGSGPESSGNNVELSARQHEFPFQFTLPMNIPHSFKDKYGRIEYYLKAVIDKAWGFDNKCKLPLNVTGTLSLDHVPNAKVPAQNQATKHFCCWCCKSGPLSAMVRLDRTGYLPGEKMVINAEITNLTNRTVSQSIASLQMEIVYYATMGTKRCTTEIASLKKGSIKQGESDIWNGELLEIPSVAPSNLEHCSIIDVEYTLNFSISCFGAMDLKLPLKIIIGTQPVGYSFYQ